MPFQWKKSDQFKEVRNKDVLIRIFQKENHFSFREKSNSAIELFYENSGHSKKHVLKKHKKFNFPKYSFKANNKPYTNWNS